MSGRSFIEKGDRSCEFAPQLAHFVVSRFRRNSKMDRVPDMDAMSKRHRDHRPCMPEVALRPTLGMFEGFVAGNDAAVAIDKDRATWTVFA